METPVYVGSTYRCNNGRGAEVVIRLLSNDFNRMNDESSSRVIFQLTEEQAPNDRSELASDLNRVQAAVLDRQGLRGLRSRSTVGYKAAQ